MTKPGVTFDLGDGRRLGLGLAALGRPGYINLGHGADYASGRDVEEMRARAHQVLDAAYAAGVRYFDAARSYGLAEDFLGSWLTASGLRSDQVAVGSKWGYSYTAAWAIDADVHEVKELTLETFKRQRGETMERLGPWLRLYQIHSATLESGVLDDGPLLESLREFRDETGVRLGLSVSAPGQGETVTAAVSRGLFDAVQATWNPLDTSAGSALMAAHAHGMWVIVKEALANGRLTARGAGPAVELLGAEARRASAQRDREIGIDAVALSVVLAQPWVDTVLSGASTVAMFESNLRALELTPSADLLGDLQAVAMAPDAYWAARSALPWN